jgi:hypothetical protein
MKQDQGYFHYYSYAILKHPAQRYITPPSFAFFLLLHFTVISYPTLIGPGVWS